MGLFDIFKKNPPKPDNPAVDDKFIVSITPPKPPTQAELDKQVILVETRIKSAVVSKQGLYPHEILVLDYAHTFYTSNNSFQGFWWYRYGVRDVQTVLASLEQRGFIEAGDLRAALNNQTGATLKELLKANGQKQTGKKDELVQRTLDTISEDALNSRFPHRPYSLTETGKTAVKDGAYVPYIHRHAVEDLDIWSLNTIIYTEPYMPYRDKIWGYLNQCSMKHFSDMNFGLYRNCRFSMSQFLKQENKVADSLAMLAEVVFYDLCGASNNYDPQFLEIYAKYLFPYEKSNAITAPCIISAIVDCQKELDYTDDQLKAALIERMSKLSAPIQLFPAEDCAKIVLLERDEDTEALKSIYAKAKKAFKQKHPEIKI